MSEKRPTLHLNKKPLEGEAMDEELRKDSEKVRAEEANGASTAPAELRLETPEEEAARLDATKQAPAEQTLVDESTLAGLHLETSDEERERLSIADRTPAELRKGLHEAVAQFQHIDKNAESLGESLRMAEALSKRSREQDEKLEKLGAFMRAGRAIKKLDDDIARNLEGGLRTFGELYDKKLGPKQKLALGIALGVGMGASLGAGALSIAVPFMLGAAVQRVAGLGSAFNRAEKKLVKKGYGGGRRKERAMANAMLWTVFPALGVDLVAVGAKDLMEQFQQHQWGDAITKWLGNTLTHTPQHHPGAMPSPDTFPGPHAEHLSRAASVTAHAPHLDVAPVHAVAGKGYEEMLFKMGQELHDKYPHGLPENISHDSDAWKLWHAASDTHSQEALQHAVHRMAADSQHHFFDTQTHESVLVNQDSQVQLNASGNVEFAQHGAHFTEGAPAHAEMASTPEATLASMGTGKAQDWVDNQGFSINNPLDARSGHSTYPGYWTDRYGNLVHDRFGAPIHTGNMHDAAAQAVLHHTAPGEMVNQFHVTVAEHTAHIYGGTGDKLFVYGGSQHEQSAKALEYLRQHPDATVFEAGVDELNPQKEYLVPVKLVNGALRFGRPVQQWWGGWTAPPNPDEFHKLID